MSQTMGIPMARQIRRLCCALLGAGMVSTAVFAADHGDAPLVSNDQGADIADVYAFLDPNDNNFLVTIITARGFITPGESENLGFFQDKLNWRFAIETTGDASPDFNAEVTFSPRTDFLAPQTATVKLRQGSVPIITPFAAPTTISVATSKTAPAQVVTTDLSGISVFAGMTDDPFFFDVPAELQFRDSLINSPPAPEVFARGRDTFGGLNVMSVALRIPLSLIGAVGNTALGVSGYTEPTQFTISSRAGGNRNIGRFVNVDRMGIPGINTVLLPYLRKDEYNRGSTSQDPAGVYVDDIVAALTALKTNAANIDLLADLVVSRGDILRVDTTVPNTGGQGGGCPTGALCDNTDARLSNLDPAGFPNGRRLADDPIDVIVNIIANGLFDDDGTVDNVNTNDRAFSDTFPFLAPPHQPDFPTP